MRNPLTVDEACFCIAIGLHFPGPQPTSPVDLTAAVDLPRSPPVRCGCIIPAPICPHAVRACPERHRSFLKVTGMPRTPRSLLQQTRILDEEEDKPFTLPNRLRASDSTRPSTAPDRESPIPPSAPAVTA